MSNMIGVLGAGAWGMALAVMLGRSGHQVRVYARNIHTVCHVRQYGMHPLFPNHPLPSNIEISNDSSVLNPADVLISAIPVQVTPPTLVSLSLPLVPIILCSKGLYQPEGHLLSDAVRAVCSHPLAVLSGPSFADEVVASRLTAVVLATETQNLLDQLHPLFQDPTFCVERSLDMVGVQLGGALKNVLAFFSGMILGAGYSENTRAAMINQGLHELILLGKTWGAQSETFYGLSGLGDIFLSATSSHSRNFCLGYKIGQDGVQEADETFQALTEGRHTASSLQALIQRISLPLPVLGGMASVIQGHVSLEEGLQNMWTKGSRGWPHCPIGF